MTTYIDSPGIIANGISTWSGTVEDYDRDVLEFETERFYRVLYETAGDVEITGLVSAKEALDPMVFHEFVERLFDDPNITITTDAAPIE